MIPFLFIGGGLYFLFDALGNQRPSVDPADLGLPTKGFRGYRKGGHYAMGGRTEPNDDICSACRGSGEGSTPDSTCSICGGSGVIEADEDYDGYESDGYDDTNYEKEWGGLDNFKNGGQTMYKGLEVEIRPASKYSKKFIVWDLETNQIFANEKFDSKDEAKKFIEQNKMKLK